MLCIQAVSLYLPEDYDNAGETHKRDRDGGDRQQISYPKRIHGINFPSARLANDLAGFRL